MLVPLLLLAAALAACRPEPCAALTDDDGKRVQLVLGALTLLVWVAVVWVCWAILDWCDDQIPRVGRLSELAGLGARAGQAPHL